MNFSKGYFQKYFSNDLIWKIFGLSPTSSLKLQKYVISDGDSYISDGFNFILRKSG